MREPANFGRSQLFKYGLIASNLFFEVMIYLFTDIFSTKLILTFLGMGIIMMFGIFLNTPTRDVSARVSGIAIVLTLPITAAVDPASRHIAETFNSIGIFAAYVLADLESIDLVNIIVNLSAWIVYWVYNQELICRGDKSDNGSNCVGMKYVVTQFVANALMAINTYGYIKHKETVLKKAREMQSLVESNLRTQEKLNIELRKTMEMNDNFLMAFSHELKNPLNALLGSIELAQDEPTSEEVKTLLTNADMSGRMLLNLLTNILDSGKIQLNKLDTNIVPGNFIEYVENLWNTISILIKAKGLKGSLTISQDFPSRVVFDPHRLSQILLNLVSNSLKFTEKGYLKIHLSFEYGTDLLLSKFEPRYLPTSARTDYEEMSFAIKHNPRVVQFRSNPLNQKLIFMANDAQSRDNEIFQLDFQRKRFPNGYFEPQRQSREGYIRIEIVDTGCGMSNQQMANLFQRFSQVNDNATKRQIGTGLGLWISKELCKLMKGDIKVYSRESLGTSFVVMVKSEALPDNRDEQRVAHTIPPMQIRKSKCSTVDNLDTIMDTELPERLGSRSNNDLDHMTLKPTSKALVAEDLVYNQEIYKRMMLKEKVAAVITNNGAEAVNMFKQSPSSFQFLLFDLNMPELDGISASKLIREYEKSNNLKKNHIIIVTGHCTQETRKLCLDSGGPVQATEVLLKPLTQSDFARICQVTMVGSE